MKELDELFFTKTLLGIPVKTVGIWLSGGADSSLLCYMIAEKILKENYDIKIQPISVQKRPGETVTVDVLEKIKELLDAERIFKEHILYKTPSDWAGDDYHSLFKKKNHEHLINGTYQLIFSGITSNISTEDQRMLGQTVNVDIEEKRGLDVVKELVKCSIGKYQGNLIEEMEVRPFFNMNKKNISAKYAELGLLNTLFPITKSCEDRSVPKGHCGKCWWCLERKWAFGKL
jgi:7-cyano-7-deazaguanine synthase in queuosine biosynthesis